MATRVNIVANPLEALKENVFVAVNIEGYKNPPVIGKVRSVSTEDSTFEEEYWKGSWKKEWKPWKLSNGELWTNWLPNKCILLVDFKLNDTNKLSYETYKYLRHTFRSWKETSQIYANCKLFDFILLMKKL